MEYIGKPPLVASLIGSSASGGLPVCMYMRGNFVGGGGAAVHVLGVEH